MIYASRFMQNKMICIPCFMQNKMIIEKYLLYVSHNTRRGKWGMDAIGTISRMLKADMPGLRGYSETTLKRMRIFYEAWVELDSTLGTDNSSFQMDELKEEYQSVTQAGDSCSKKKCPPRRPSRAQRRAKIRVHPCPFVGNNTP